MLLALSFSLSLLFSFVIFFIPISVAVFEDYISIPHAFFSRLYPERVTMSLLQLLANQVCW